MQQDTARRRRGPRESRLLLGSYTHTRTPLTHWTPIQKTCILQKSAARPSCKLKSGRSISPCQSWMVRIAASVNKSHLTLSARCVLFKNLVHNVHPHVFHLQVYACFPRPPPRCHVHPISNTQHGQCVQWEFNKCQLNE